MSLIEAIRSQLTTSIKEKNETKKSILRVILGDLSTLESRSGKKPNDDDVRHVIKKLLEGNMETLKYTVTNDYLPGRPGNPELHEKLTGENNILTSFLPQTLSKEEVRAKLESLMPLSSTMVIYDISNAKGDGQATGVAMKYFKEQGLNVEGMDVAEVVKELRYSLSKN